MTPEDLVIGLKVRLIVNLPKLPAGSIGIVKDVADDPPQRGGGVSGSTGLNLEAGAIT